MPGSYTFVTNRSVGAGHARLLILRRDFCYLSSP